MSEVNLTEKNKNNNFVYLDAAASASAGDAEIFDNFANPNATHDAGRVAFAALEEAREKFAKTIGAKRPSEIIWTSGATEANNMAIFGIARAIKQNNNVNKNKVAVLEIEHESALMPALELANEGFEVNKIRVEKSGFVDIQKYENLIDENTALVIVQLANTEIGNIQNIEQLCEIAHKNGAKFHSDCVGALGWIDIDVQKLGVDSASFSGHKIGAPKGIGAMYLKANTPIKPLIFGGEQEAGLRAGTQSVALAVSMAERADACNLKIQQTTANCLRLRKYLFDQISQIDGVNLTVDVRADDKKFLWNIANLIYDNFSNKSLILKYGKFGVIISGGPACSSDNEKPSHVLTAIGVAKNKINNALRISFSQKSTIEDVESFIAVTRSILNAD